MKPKLSLLTDKFFLLGLATLLINDFVLKYEAGGWITGKLSDISGLFIFPFFWSIFFERYRFFIYVLTSIMFVIWKLPVSTGMLNAFNEFAETSFSRVVDYTDLFTLFIIPVSYVWLNHRLKSPSLKNKLTFGPAGISIVSIIAFIATSIPPHGWMIEYKTIDKKLICHVGKEEIFKNHVVTNNRLTDNLQDSSFRVRYTMSEQKGVEAVTWVRIYPLDSIHTVFFIDSLELYTYLGGLIKSKQRRMEIKKENKLRRISRKKLIADFEKNVIKQLESGKVVNPIYFENPKLDTLKY